jgi:hypothetical protein
MSPEARFNALKRELGLSSHQLGLLLSRPWSTVATWEQTARTDCQPPSEALEAMETELVGRVTDRIHSAGLDVIPLNLESLCDGAQHLNVSYGNTSLNEEGQRK